MLPGSRRKEVRFILPTLSLAAKLISEKKRKCSWFCRSRPAWIAILYSSWREHTSS